MPISCLGSSSGSTAKKTSREPGLAWPPCSELCTSTAGRSGRRGNWTREPGFTLPWERHSGWTRKFAPIRERKRMWPDEVEILLVEDNPDDVELAIHALRRENLANRIEIARDGEEALDFLFCRGRYINRSFQSPPRLVLLDLKLPKGDGLEGLKEIKGDPRTKAIPVIIITSSREEQDLVNGYMLGVNAYIQKPVDFAQFREMVKQLGLFWLVGNQPPPAAAFQAG